jgi:hypothetical protein
LTNFLRHSCRGLILVLAALGSAQAQLTPGFHSTVAAAALPDAPQPQASPQPTGGAVEPARHYAQVIEPGQVAKPFTAPEKLVFSLTEVARPITLIPALWSAGWEQIFLTDPKYGSDGAAYGEKFGAALLRSSSVRIFSDGIFAALFHQDPRYYRVAQGSYLHRSLLSAEQAIVTRGDNGSQQFNYSGIAGRAAAAALTTTYYPEPSVNARVVGLTFATSIATDAGGNLVVEFLPDIIRKIPVMKKLRLE